MKVTASFLSVQNGGSTSQTEWGYAKRSEYAYRQRGSAGSTDPFRVGYLTTAGYLWRCSFMFSEEEKK